MGAATIAIICTTIFGTTTTLSVFIRRLLLSRNKNLNDEAQYRAFAHEAKELEKIHEEMTNKKRFQSHYQMLGLNKDAVQYLDDKIEELLKKKLYQIQQYAQMVIRESFIIIGGEQSYQCKVIFEDRKKETDLRLKFYDGELQQLQKRRAALWDAHFELQDYFLGQEQSRNNKLNSLYQRYTGLLQKSYIRQNEAMELNAFSFKFMLDPVQTLLQYFKLSHGIWRNAAFNEISSRQKIATIEYEINGSAE